MKNPPYRLTAESARIVLAAICEVCSHRNWGLLAAHVRLSHAHVVTDLGSASPDEALRDFKAYASRVLNRSEGSQRRWSRGGSTIPLQTDKAIQNVLHYVVCKQGNAIAVFDARQ